MSPEQRVKDRARSYANVNLRRGKLTRQACSCGATTAEMHHNDYSKPLQVTWQCRRCHLLEHETETPEQKAAREATVQVVLYRLALGLDPYP